MCAVYKCKGKTLALTAYKTRCLCDNVRPIQQELSLLRNNNPLMLGLGSDLLCSAQHNKQHDKKGVKCLCLLKSPIGGKYRFLRSYHVK